MQLLSQPSPAMDSFTSGTQFLILPTQAPELGAPDLQPTLSNRQRQSEPKQAAPARRAFGPDASSLGAYRDEDHEGEG